MKKYVLVLFLGIGVLMGSSLEALAVDVMAYEPRTPAGGATGALLPSYLEQAVAVWGGPEVIIEQSISRDTEQVTVQELYTIENGERILQQEQVSTTTIRRDP
jgi:hypothetical protein